MRSATVDTEDKCLLYDQLSGPIGPITPQAGHAGPFYEQLRLGAQC
jgi:hypothetical protein